jgi:DNA polymerase III delta prime subunit
MIFFDEADRLTPQAQDALKRTIDDYSKNTIFVFCTNNIHKIIEPLKSRANTTTFQIGYASDEVIQDMVVSIAQQLDEGFEMSMTNIKDIVKTAHGEPRHAVNLLQSYVDGSFTVPDVSVHDRFIEFISKTLSSNYSPLEVLHLINEDDLDGLSMSVLENEELYVLVRKHGKSHYDILKIIADTDRAMQHSINKDVHLLNMIIRLSEL